MLLGNAGTGDIFYQTVNFRDEDFVARASGAGSGRDQGFGAFAPFQPWPGRV
jgi:hypothetical protein